MHGVDPGVERISAGKPVWLSGASADPGRRDVLLHGLGQADGIGLAGIIVLLCLIPLIKGLSA